MVTKDEIHAEVERVRDEYLDELYQLIKNFTRSKGRSKKPSLMSQLQNIKIEAPEDFAENFDLYTSGEKQESDKYSPSRAVPKPL